MNFAVSLATGILLMSLNLAGLAFITSRLGRGEKLGVFAAYAALWFLKLIILAGGVFLLVRSRFFDYIGLFLGLGIPVVFLAVWQMTHLGKKKS